MDNKIRIIANWKSNKNAEEVLMFVDSLKVAWSDLQMDNKELVLLPSFTALSVAYAYREAEGLPIKLGAQDISGYDVGAFTGDVNGAQIAEFCEFVLINHSERRKYNHESDQEARAKVNQALKYNLTPLFCVQNENSGIPDGVTEVMYEPPGAISTFQEGAQAQGVHEIERVFSVIKNRYENVNLYYGGSVDKNNILQLLDVPNIKGFLIGGASLDVEKFAEILTLWS